MRLTDVAIKRMKLLPEGQKRYRDDLLPGFGVTVGTRAKTFFVMYGPERRIKTLGRYPEKSLQDARNEARQVLAQIPQRNRHERLPELAKAFLEDCESRLRPKSVAAYRGILNQAPDIPLGEVNRSTVTVRTAHEIKTYKALFNWAMREEIVQRNPFAHLTARFGKRERVLSTDEIKKLWAYDHKPFSTMLKLLLLTGQRRSQIWKLQPEWIEGNTVTFPAEIMKGGENHTIPIGPLASELAKEAPFSFNAWSKAKVHVDEETGIVEWTIHDLRRTFVTICAEIGVPLHVTETYVDHRSGTISGVQAIYLRYDFMKEMGELANTLEQHLTKVVEM